MDWSDLTWNQFHGQLTSLGWKPRRYVKISWLRLRLSRAVGTKGKRANCPTDFGRISKPFPWKGLGLMLNPSQIFRSSYCTAEQQPQGRLQGRWPFSIQTWNRGGLQGIWMLNSIFKVTYYSSYKAILFNRSAFFKKQHIFYLMYFCGIRYLSILEFNLRGCKRKGQEGI